MKIGRRRREEAEVESSAMNDIMFFLMLFFLIASTLANPNVINITLPKAKTTTAVHTKTLPITVKNVIENGVKTDQVEIYFEQKLVAFEDMEAILTAERDKYADPANPQNGLNVVLRLEKDLEVQKMVDVMQIVANLGIKMVLATDKSTK